MCCCYEANDGWILSKMIKWEIFLFFKKSQEEEIIDVLYIMGLLLLTIMSTIYCRLHHIVIYSI